MVLLRKKSAGNAPGYSWDADGAVVDVDDALAQELLGRPGDEFVEVPAEEKPDPESTEVTEPEPEADDEPAATEDDSPKKTTRRRTKVNE